MTPRAALPAALAALIAIAGCCGPTEGPAPSPSTSASGGAPEPVPTPLSKEEKGAAVQSAFDREWVVHLPRELSVYAAVRDLSFYDPLAGTGADGDKLSRVRKQLAARQGSPEIADWLDELNDHLLESGAVKASFLELLPRGFAIGLRTEGQGAPARGLLVAPSTGPLVERIEAFAKDASASGARTERRTLGTGELVVLSREGREAVLAIHLGKSFLVAGNDAGWVEDAVKRAAETGESFRESVHYREAVARLDENVSFFVALDAAGFGEAVKSRVSEGAAELESGTAAAASGPLAMATAMARSARPAERAASLAELVQTLAVQYVHGTPVSHLDVVAGMREGPELQALRSVAWPDSPLSSARLVSINSPVFAALNLGGPGPEGPEGPDVAGEPGSDLLDQMRTSLAMFLGLDYATDVQPWIGREFSAALLWDAQMPELALMASVRDEKAARQAMDRVASNFRGRVDFKSTAIGGHDVRHADLLGRPFFHPTYTVARGFLVLATGLQVTASLLDAPDKLADQPGFATLFTVMGGDRLPFTAFLETSVLERLAEMSGPKLMALHQSMRQACFANLGAIAAGRLEAAAAVCAAGGTYSAGPDGVVCSVHGSTNAPERIDPDSLNPELAAARSFRELVQSIAVGGAMTEPGVFRLSMVFRRP